MFEPKKLTRPVEVGGRIAIVQPDGTHLQGTVRDYQVHLTSHGGRKYLIEPDGVGNLPGWWWQSDCADAEPAYPGEVFPGLYESLLQHAGSPEDEDSDDDY